MPSIPILIALSLFISAYPQAQVLPSTARLTEPGEEWANRIQPPDLVMDLIGIKPGLVIGEVGAGRGRGTVHLAERVGEKGKFYANDINEKALAYLKERCRKNGQGNVETILGAVDDARLPKNALDLVFMAWVFHHVDKPVPLLKSLVPSLKPWGAVIMVEPIPPEAERSARALTEDLIPGALRKMVRNFEILIFLELDDFGDWGGPPTGPVRMIARKRES